MEILLAIAIGILVAAAAYLLLARDLPRALLGFVLLGTAANLSIFASGRIGTMTPPLVDLGAHALAAHAANPLPQALVLTAIVIGFGLAAFTLVLIRSAHGAIGTVTADEMHEAETPDEASSSPALVPDAAAPSHRREAA